MRCSWMGVVVLSLSALLVGGCSSGGNSAGSAVQTENQRLQQDNQNLRRALAERDAILAGRPDMSGQLVSLQQETAARDARIKELESQLKQQPAAAPADPSIAGIETTYDRKKGELTVNLPADILFTPGSAELKPTSKSTLDKVVAAIRKDYPGKTIRVEGHTDSDPITRTKDQWIDNIDLSVNRAAAVTRYLVSKGVKQQNVVTAGWGEAKPKQNKPASRRVEIVVVMG
jgi:chemotaxis protein MotB